jgi:hypothetical protein
MIPGLERQGDAQDVAEAIATVVEADAGNRPLTGSHALDAATVALYAARESGLHMRPHPWSWDASAGVSCGILQLPCKAVRWATLDEQVRLWLRLARQGGLPALDSSPARAAHREFRARALLAGVLAADLVP